MKRYAKKLKGTLKISRHAEHLKRHAENMKRHAKIFKDTQAGRDIERHAGTPKILGTQARYLEESVRYCPWCSKFTMLLYDFSLNYFYKGGVRGLILP